MNYLIMVLLNAVVHTITNPICQYVAMDIELISGPGIAHSQLLRKAKDVIGYLFTANKNIH